MTRLPELPVSHYGWMRVTNPDTGSANEVWEAPNGKLMVCQPGCTLTIHQGNLLCRRVQPKHGTERLVFVIKLEDAL